MSLFGFKADIDLSDDSLAERAEAEDNAVDAEEAMAAVETDADAAADEAAAEPINAAAQGDAAQASISAARSSLYVGLPDPDAAWQQATDSVAHYWPQAGENMRELVHKMVELSARLGDPTLWQRAPVQMMREAACELYGMPPVPDKQRLDQALAAAQAEGARAAQVKHQAKLGLEPPLSARNTPPALSEEERIRAEIRSARSSRLF